MNTIYYLLNEQHAIERTSYDLIYLLHEFLKGRTFQRLAIEPFNEEIQLDIPENGTMRTDQSYTTNVNALIIKRIKIDDRIYYVTTYQYQN